MRLKFCAVIEFFFQNEGSVLTSVLSKKQYSEGDEGEFEDDEGSKYFVRSSASLKLTGNNNNSNQASYDDFNAYMSSSSQPNIHKQSSFTSFASPKLVKRSKSSFDSASFPRMSESKIITKANNFNY